MVKKEVNFLGVGDLILARPGLEKFFEPSKNILKSGDITLGQVESPHTNRGQWSSIESRSMAASDPDNLDVLKDVGFTVATTAGNHTFDQGYYGVMDTLDKLHELGIETTGSGANLEEAKKPILYEKDGIKIAIIQYSCLGPNYAWATPAKAGANFIRVVTAYGVDLSEPGSVPEQCWTFPDPATLNTMCMQVSKLKEDGYNVIATFHIGNMWTQEILPYDFDITHRAIEAGADAVLSSHAHEPRGITTYKGKPIFHGLGNFVTLSSGAAKDPVLTSFMPHKWQGVQPTQWELKVGSAFLDWSKAKIPNYPYTEDSRNTLIVKLVFVEKGISKAGFYPCYIDDTGAPVPVKKDGKGTDVLSHIEWLNNLEGISADFSWSEDGSIVYINLPD